jgi:hypothetical protein
MRKTIALAVAAVALTGCGMLPAQQGAGGGERQASGESSRPAADPSAADPSGNDPSGNGPVARESAASAPAQDGQVIATRQSRTMSGSQAGRARADITSLRRQGRILTLSWTITALDGRVNLHNGMGTATLDFSVAAVSLIDPVNAKRYRVARNGTGSDATCVCSRTQGQFLAEGETSTLYAVFAAPPPDVTKVDVEMPMIGVIPDVPVS